MCPSARLSLLAIGGSITLTLAVSVLSRWVYIDATALIPVLFVGCIGGWSLWNRWEGEELQRRLDSEQPASQSQWHGHSD